MKYLPSLVEATPVAREMVRDYLQAAVNAKVELYVRVNPLDGPWCLADIAAVAPAGHRMEQPVDSQFVAVLRRRSVVLARPLPRQRSVRCR